MAVSDKAVEFLGNSLNTGRPIPGQSLTNSPEQPYKWEQPSEFVNTGEATTYVFGLLTEPETTSNLLLSITNGVSIIDLASIVLYSGFLEGKWNPDLMTLLMEPTMFMIMALAEKADIEYQMESGESEQPIEMSPDNQIKFIKSRVNELDKIREQSVSKINPKVIPEKVRQMVEEVELSPSLLEKVKTVSNKSLLGKGE
jgi:hypothetical protein